ncbi:hypothetical protein SPRG_06480 [Saprolegnia parasitica CBS 223.65]|uniref:Uncharacterized protein n=1 Tax=Saprolegnia parasitica (strain CBS 223.65) TaxID=695850 RepID=A0A067CHG4_SAPPC|nr:hypothetical protein SPRG_06480 [Saprolegnia parasitica CBS 223.65]KDO28625.1 hypothetical protein SPRG_06480 [Saprolegnia parasitica CBS 223.65]|eukprot:XP_012200687.1 hypothetical protein SPRG_06480 [Saprolegnia parasitica CBS 223.65]
MPRINVASTTSLKRQTLRRALRMGQGAILSNLCLAFATIVAFCTYSLEQIANADVYMGLVHNAFDSNQFHVPVFTLLEGASTLRLEGTTQIARGSISLSHLLYHACGIHDMACATAFLPDTNQIWSHIGLAFHQIPDFETPRFQDTSEDIRFQHVNSLSGWNKALVQYYIPGYATAITCMIRRANYSINGDASLVDTLAFCSHRAYDPKWRCENDVPDDTRFFLFQLRMAESVYLGSLLMRDVYFNPGATATAVRGAHGDTTLGPVTAVDEYQAGVLQASAPWDVLPASRCYDYDPSTGLGWLLQMQGRVNVRWACSSILRMNTILLWILTAYYTTLQWLFARQSRICLVAVCLSKNVLGITVLFVTIWGNANLQTLTTYFAQNPIASTKTNILALCGPRLSRPLSLCFTPRVVTQTWLLTLFTLLNWGLIFGLEVSVFPYLNLSIPGPCGFASSTNCIHLTAIPQTYYLSAVVAAVVVVVAVGTIRLHARCFRDTLRVPPTHSVLQYLGVQDLREIATSGRGCVFRNFDGEIVVDHGLLVMKNMLRITNTYLTRLANAQYDLLHWFLPRYVRSALAHKFRTILVVHIENDKITRRSYYVPMHSVHVDGDAVCGLGFS